MKRLAMAFWLHPGAATAVLVDHLSRQFRHSFVNLRLR
jgi:hypothetical protein